jgi:hypothetical protein
MKSIYT